MAAYLRMLGMTQAQAGRAVGRSVRSIRDWEMDKPLWGKAREEAQKRWLADTMDASRQTVLQSIRGGDGELAFRVLERTDPALAPPAYQHKHSGEVDVTMHVQAARDRLGSKLRVIADRQEVSA